MITTLCVADIKLNKTDKDYRKYLLVINDEGTTIIDEDQFVLSFTYTSISEISKNEDIKNIKHVAYVDL